MIINKKSTKEKKESLDTAENKSQQKEYKEKQSVEKESIESVKNDIEKDIEIADKPVKFFEAIGKRKTAKARVRLFTRGEKKFLVNDKLYDEYFSIFELQQIAIASLEKMKLLNRFRIIAKVHGGGVRAQSEAIRHALAKILIQVNPIFRKRLKKSGYLTRDSRMRERKKFGLKRARRAPQWRKR